MPGIARISTSIARSTGSSTTKKRGRTGESLRQAIRAKETPRLSDTWANTDIDAATVSPWRETVRDCLTTVRRGREGVCEGGAGGREEVQTKGWRALRGAGLRTVGRAGGGSADGWGGATDERGRDWRGVIGKTQNRYGAVMRALRGRDFAKN